MKRLRWLAVSLLFGFTGVAVLLGWLQPPLVAAAPSLPAISPIPEISRLHPELFKAIVTGVSRPIPVIIQYRRAPSLLAPLPASPDKLAARQQLIAALQADAALYAPPILDAIQTLGGGTNVRSYWLSGVIALNATPALIASLSLRSEILQIRPDAQFQIPALQPSPDFLLHAPGSLPQWNLSLINAPLANTALGLDGSGTVVANLDTGVDWTHPALQPHYRGYNGGTPNHTGNWHVSTGEFYPAPGDVFGHGTHTMGTMVGDDGAGNRTGVAPGAQWIAVKMISDDGIFYESWAHDAFQWIMAPEGNPALAPDVVNNSWGTYLGGDARFQPDIAALRLAGILPVFSAGNNGPFQTTITSPADYPESLAVAAVDDAGLVTTFSGRGPSMPPWNETKPEIGAPGVDVNSTVPGGAYLIADGTSMAAPHIAGAAALLLQADPTLTPDALEAALIGTATPLGAVNPNNNTGWGLVNVYAAALTLLPHGTIAGTVTDANGDALNFARVTAVSAGTGISVTISGNAMGAYGVSLPGGVYTITGYAFGFGAQIFSGVSVSVGAQTIQDFALARLPSGTVQGAVIDLETGLPISATIVVTGTPLTVQTNAGGEFSFPLLPGVWGLDVTALAHRRGHYPVTVSVGQTTTLAAALPAAPSILLVDSGRWYYDTRAGYFVEALDALDFPFDLWEVRDPFGLATGVSDTPVITDLIGYDVVIWSAPGDSPGLIQAGRTISMYLGLGGQALISGQDVAFWDGGGNLAVYPTYFPLFGAAHFDYESVFPGLTGVADTPFSGTVITLNTPDSDQSQFLVDSVAVDDSLQAEVAAVWPDGSPGILLAGGCDPYRLAWTGFGLEGAGPRPTRIDAFDRLLEWLQTAPPEIGIYAAPLPDPLIGAPGTLLTHTIRLENTGTQTETFDLALAGGAWPLSVTLPAGTTVTQTSPLTLPGCTGAVITATLAIPDGLPRDTDDTAALTLTSQQAPAVTTSLTLHAKTPAPLLLLDDGLFFFHGQQYADALDSLGLSYDFVQLNGGPFTQNILPRYPLVIWTTGQDWFRSLPTSEQQMIIAYLDGGGRLLLTSQDLLDRASLTPLAHDYLGAAGYTLEITPTVVVRAAGPPEPWPLTYSFVNWSDGMQLQPGARPVMLDAQGYIVGAANQQDDWRTMFFSFPLETLPPAALEAVLVESLLWLGPYGGSDLMGVDAAPEGARLPLTLTLNWSRGSPQENLTATVSLPPEMALVPDSLTGLWVYDTQNHALIWEGGLSTGVTRTFGAQVDLASGIPDGTALTVRAVLDAGDGEISMDRYTVWVDAPRLVVAASVSPNLLRPPEDVLRPVVFTVTVTNTGYLTSPVTLTDTLPAGLTLLTDTLTATAGSVTLNGVQITWTGSLPPGGSAGFSFMGTVNFPRPPGLLVNWVTVWDGFQKRAAWAILEIRGTLYFPIVRH